MWNELEAADTRDKEKLHNVASHLVIFSRRIYGSANKLVIFVWGWGMGVRSLSTKMDNFLVWEWLNRKSREGRQGGPIWDYCGRRDAPRLRETKKRIHIFFFSQNAYIHGRSPQHLGLTNVLHEKTILLSCREIFTTYFFAFFFFFLYLMLIRRARVIFKAHELLILLSLLSRIAKSLDENNSDKSFLHLMITIKREKQTRDPACSLKCPSLTLCSVSHF